MNVYEIREDHSWIFDKVFKVERFLSYLFYFLKHKHIRGGHGDVCISFVLEAWHIPIQLPFSYDTSSYDN